MNCDLARTEMVAYLRGELDERARVRLENHLAGCPACRQQMEEARRVLEWTEAATDEGVVRALDEILTDAAKARASDVHFETESDGGLRVRMRVDGVLDDLRRVEPAMRAGILARIKTLADMTVGETRLPQDGRIRTELNGTPLDLRVASCPFIWGENISVRLLDSAGVLIGLERLGLSEEVIAQVEAILHLPNGMFLVSGPTGSGKTTTLYSALLRLDTNHTKVMSIEDPVEYSLPGVNQSAVSRRTGYSFPSALRSFMRMDPDVIMVGELPDRETLQLSLQAAITGHFVVTTLHANDTAGVIRRLRDMGAEDFILASSLVGISAQRLVRRVCQACRMPVQWHPDDPAVRALGITARDLETHELMEGAGCEQCRGTGYRGRTAVYEVLAVDRDIKAMIADGVGDQEIVKRAMDKGFATMRQDGRRRVLDGSTTPHEAYRVLAW